MINHLGPHFRSGLYIPQVSLSLCMLNIFFKCVQIHGNVNPQFKQQIQIRRQKKNSSWWNMIKIHNKKHRLRCFKNYKTITPLTFHTQSIILRSASKDLCAIFIWTLNITLIIGLWTHYDSNNIFILKKKPTNKNWTGRKWNLSASPEHG